MPTTLTLNDSEKTMSLTTAAPLCTDDPPISQLNSTLAVVNDVAPISTVSLTGSTYTVTFKDARSYALDISAGPPITSQVTSASFWTPQEVSVLQNLAATINVLLVGYGMNAMTVTYA